VYWYGCCLQVITIRVGTILIQVATANWVSAWLQLKSSPTCNQQSAPAECMYSVPTSPDAPCSVISITPGCHMPVRLSVHDPPSAKPHRTRVNLSAEITESCCVQEVRAPSRRLSPCHHDIDVQSRP
jgi:hypothetical protein